MKNPKPVRRPAPKKLYAKPRIIEDRRSFERTALTKCCRNTPGCQAPAAANAGVAGLS